MKLIKLTDVCCGDTLYINSNCILSCEHKYHNESNKWYTKVGLLYENRFEFWYAKETIEDIQEQLLGKDNCIKFVKIEDKNYGGLFISVNDIKMMTLKRSEDGKLYWGIQTKDDVYFVNKLPDALKGMMEE